ncbi:uncharacterized protein P884DRAFT_250305 [Thermothelomyces heterothallicus CBS 202.75]|uniref:uncharacterized protein n=1 Tax=Thermothelomyces heterothallicus CBS 202.75 TaxID=1149848 RepID=UPI0037441E27
MAPNNRSPGLPAIPDMVQGETERLIPELEEAVSSTGETIVTVTLEDDECRPARSHSTSTQNSRRPRRTVLPSRFPSTSSSNSPAMYPALPVSPRHYDITCQVQPLQLPSSKKKVYESWTITYHHPAPRPPVRVRVLGLTLFRLSGRPSEGRPGEGEGGSILSVVPNTHFSQDELAGTVAMHEAAAAAHAAQRNKGNKGQGRRWWWRPKTATNTLCKPRLVGSGSGSGSGAARRGRGGSCWYVNDQEAQDGGDGNGNGNGTGTGTGTGTANTGIAIGIGTGSWDAAVYAADLEKRIRRLDWKVQDEIYELLSDRVQSSSNAFRRRDWRVVVLTEVPGGELTDQPTGFRAFGEREGGGGWRRWRRRRRRESRGSTRRTPPPPPHDMPVTEYRLILRGTETKANDQGWGYYNRYSRPWRDADEKELGHRRRWSTMTGKNEKYVDF